MKKQLLNLFALVEKWGEERNFYAEDGTTAGHQFIKLIEEQGEMCGNIARGKDPTDDIGDQVVVLIHVARLSGNSFLKFDWDLLQDNALEVSVIRNVMDLTYLYGRLSTVLNNDFISTLVTKNLLVRVLVELNTLALSHDTTLLHCLEHSYNEIKDRKGKMVNSVYVKESDIIQQNEADGLTQKAFDAAMPCMSELNGMPIIFGTGGGEGIENGIQKYRKLSVEIEAVKWTGRYSSMLIIEEFMGVGRGALSRKGLEDNTMLYIQTLEGVMFATVGDYIIKEPFPTGDREFYPCKPDIFAKTYELVENFNPEPDMNEPNNLTHEEILKKFIDQPLQEKLPGMYELAYESYHMLLELTEKANKLIKKDKKE